MPKVEVEAWGALQRDLASLLAIRAAAVRHGVSADMRLTTGVDPCTRLDGFRAACMDILLRFSHGLRSKWQPGFVAGPTPPPTWGFWRDACMDWCREDDEEGRLGAATGPGPGPSTFSASADADTCMHLLRTKYGADADADADAAESVKSACADLPDLDDPGTVLGVLWFLHSMTFALYSHDMGLAPLARMWVVSSDRSFDADGLIEETCKIVDFLAHLRETSSGVDSVVCAAQAAADRHREAREARDRTWKEDFASANVSWLCLCGCQDMERCMVMYGYDTVGDMQKFADGLLQDVRKTVQTSVVTVPVPVPWICSVA